MSTSTSSTSLVSKGAMTSSFNVTRPNLRQNFARRLGRKRSRLKFFHVLNMGATPLHRPTHHCAGLSPWCRRGRRASLPYTYPFERDGRRRARGRGRRAGDAPYCGQALEGLHLPRGQVTSVSGDLSPLANFSVSWIADSGAAVQGRNVADSDMPVNAR